MNKIESKFNFKTFITFLTVLVLALSLAFATACNKSGSSESESDSTSESESTSETVTDEQTLKNGDFEFTSGKNTSKPNTATSWTIRSDGADEGYSTGTSSSYVLIDTEDEAFDALGSDYKYSTTEGEDTVFHNPRTPFYNEEAEDKGLVDDDKTEANEAGTKVMMLRNKDYSAQYATSSTTLSVPSGQYATVSIWVKTLGVEGKLGNTEVGAYIKLKHNVVDVNNDNEAYSPLLINNINTEGKWVKFVIYLAPNQHRATSYTLVLGFGEGNSVYTENHVKGFAFFDNAGFSLIKPTDLPSSVDTPTLANNSTISVSGVDFGTDNTYTVGYDLTSSNPINNLDVQTGSDGVWNAVNPYTEGNKVKEDASKVTVSADEVKIDFSGFGNIGSSYTHKVQTSTLLPHSFVRISFLAKVTTEDYQTGATLAIYDVLKGEVVASFDNVNTNDYENEYTDGFARYTFYVANNFVDATDVMQYQLQLSYGPTEKVTSTNVLPTGTAIFKGFELEELSSEEEYTSATADDYVKKVALTGNYENDYTEDEEETTDTSNDTYSITVSGMNQVNLENGLVIPVEELSSVSLTTNAPNGAFGLANSAYYTTDDGVKAALNHLKGKIKNDNKHVQALVLNANGTEYYVSGKTVTIPKNTTYSFSIKVYAHSGNAFVRLVDVDKSNADNQHVVFTALNDKAVKTTVTNADCARFEDGYAIVTYVITTGAESFDLKFEFGSNGVAVFDTLNCGTLNTTYTSAEAFMDNFYAGDADAVFTFDTDSVVPEIYFYADEADVGQEDLRLKDDDGNVRVEEGEETTVYALGKANDTATEYFAQYYRFDTDDLYQIDAGDEEETTSESTSESESVSESTTETQQYGWLQVTSIIVALVLVAALIAVVVRKSFEGKSRKKKNTEKYYQGYDKSTRRTVKNDVAVPDAEDTAKDYDYDNPDNN
ncbi:MAG: hypothetical protein IJW64_04345 [Clostridia bacterium]|nr:hypothetical protein [Clostridia bacterium]